MLFIIFENIPKLNFWVGYGGQQLRAARMAVLSCDSMSNPMLEEGPGRLPVLGSRSTRSSSARVQVWGYRWLDFLERSRESE
ncbi:LOW QUALITY PROTEIN: hypothetical protein TorRG33x02_097040 [Trema orientale]|uniref:Uncharacterized protein n=1 Tax=Trema orientale TaxID=63057 RepID=A0A2P5F9J2_TREOI|nr:LOW QUALITY PROTEIN: hypothetical protein TorRG33x02_097040 [Trema orientale]